MMMKQELDKTSIQDNKIVCECGCGGIPKPGSRFINHHHAKTENNGMWNGGRYVTSHGYVVVRKPEHPKANKDGYVYEHILVMENFLKRPLERNEIVHHINKIKTDNRIENLGRMSIGEHGRFHNKGKKKPPFTEEHRRRLGEAKRDKKDSVETKLRKSIARIKYLGSRK